MRKLALSTLFILAIALSSFAQTWQNFNYQGVARDAQGEVIENQAIGIRFSLHEGTAVGTVVYQETHSATTNEFGLFNLAIGGGTVVSGTFGDIDWGTDDFFVQVEMDPAGGTAYADMGTSQLLSVPYAMHAANAGALGVAGTSGQTLRHDGTDWIASSSLFNNGIKVGVGQIVSGELDGVFTVRGQNSATDGVEGVFLDIVNDETNTAGTLAGIRFTNYPVSPTGHFLPGGIFWKSTGQTFGRGDLVFVTGTTTGTANVNTNTRMTITNDGRVGIGTTPTHEFHIAHGLFGAINTSNGLKIENSTSGNSWTLYTYSTGNLGLFYGTTLKGTFDDATGAYATASDRRFKKNITSLNPVLDQVLKLQPSSYQYIDNKESEQRSIGLIAQELLPLFPEFVTEVGESEDEMRYAVNYAGLSVVALKAIQEQQVLIEQLQAELELLKNK